MQNPTFRYDLNGLRAYAVIFVVLFHFNILGFSAGFLGVDIFFVISGYLMSKIIIEGLEESKFSFSQFYVARITRIFPALLFLVIIITILGYFLFIPEDLKSFAKDAKYSLSFLSNDLYYRQSNDYFSANPHDKALLHTWSLSVEWQFYILFPILIYTYFKIVKTGKYFIGLLLTLFIVSLFFNIFLSNKNQMYAFFNLPARAWELIAGGLTFHACRNFIFSEKYKKWIEIFGFLLILISLIYFDKDTLWPSYFALLPVLGTMCIIIAQHQDSIFTKPKLIQSIGSASYSIYLWHWPFSFLLAYLFLEKTALVVSIAIALSVLCGWLSYRYIESSRRYLSRLKPHYCYILFFTVLSICIFIYGEISRDGLIDRASASYINQNKKMEMPQISNGWCFYNIKDQHDLKVGEDGLKCHIGSTGSDAQNVLLFGDSFAGHNIPFWHYLGKDLNLNIHAISTNWCYPSLGNSFTGHQDSTAYQQCLINRKYLKQNLAQYDVLIFAGRWSDIAKHNQLNDFEGLLRIAAQHNKKVVVMSEPYTFDANISLLYKRSVWLGRNFDLTAYIDNAKADEQKIVIKHLDTMVKRYPQTLLLTQQDLFKSDHMATKNTPYSLDGRHLSIAGSLASQQYFIQQQKYTQLKEFIYPIK